MTIGNGPLGSDGRTASLRYSVENVKRDEVCQNEDVVAIPEGSDLQSVFFSDTGVSHQSKVRFIDEVMLNSFRRTLASTIRRVFFSFYNTGVAKGKPDGCPFLTPNSWSVWRQGAKRRLIGRLLLRRENSTALSSRVETGIHTSRDHC